MMAVMLKNQPCSKKSEVQGEKKENLSSLYLVYSFECRANQCPDRCTWIKCCCSLLQSSRGSSSGRDISKSNTIALSEGHITITEKKIDSKAVVGKYIYLHLYVYMCVCYVTSLQSWFLRHAGTLYLNCGTFNDAFHVVE